VQVSSFPRRRGSSAEPCSPEHSGCTKRTLAGGTGSGSLLAAVSQPVAAPSPKTRHPRSSWVMSNAWLLVSQESSEVLGLPPHLASSKVQSIRKTGIYRLHPFAGLSFQLRVLWLTYPQAPCTKSSFRIFFADAFLIIGVSLRSDSELIH